MDFINKHSSNKYLDKTYKHQLLFFERYIQKVIYINLKEAVERNNIMKDFLDEYFDQHKIIRLDAIKDKYKGATQSHIECLNLAIKNNWENVLIIEDNAILINKNFYYLEKIIKNSYDVIHLGGTFSLFNPFNYKLYSCLSGTAYIVNNKYFKRLRDHYIEGLEKMKILKLIDIDSHCKYIFDSYWRTLQVKDNWKICYPPLFIQKKGYSYINNKITDLENDFYDVNIEFVKNRYKNTFFNFYKLNYFTIFTDKKKRVKLKLILSIIILFHYTYLNFKKYDITTHILINTIRHIFNIRIIMFLFIIFLLPIFEILNNHIKYIID